MGTLKLLTRKNRAEHDLKFTVKLYKVEETGADISDIIFSVKDDYTDADDAIFKKTLLTATITTIPATLDSTVEKFDVFVQWPGTEYTNFVIDTEYTAGLFIKFTGKTYANENVSTMYKLKVIQDFLIE